MTTPVTLSAMTGSDSWGSLPRPRASDLPLPIATTGIFRRKPDSSSARLHVVAQVLVDVGPGRRPRVATKRPRRTSSGRCARGLHQGFGQVGRHVESVMPTLSTLRDVGPDTGQRHIDDRKTHHARPQQRGGPSRPASMQAQLDGGRAHRLGERIDHRRAFAVLPTDKADRRKVRAQPELQRCQLFAPGAIEQE